ncbi:MAG TPA: beta-L-arabinofuranosidase domain-containing protein [Bacteroidota bacterium]|nr:beta-L-arabinofuranosidase domain-containing protein [Bacteroidota bacterium]
MTHRIRGIVACVAAMTLLDSASPLSVHVASAQGARVAERLAPAGPGGLYPGNRAPLAPVPLVKLPLGSVRARGWLLAQLELMRDGFSGHLMEISKWCKYDGSAWVSPAGGGEFGWEETPYWLRGFIDLGYLLDDKRITDESLRWTDGVLSSQDSTGYFGPAVNRKVPDIWPNMLMLSVLRSRYEATGDKRILPFMLGYARWLMTVPLDRYLPESWQKWRGGDNLDHIYWLYNMTGEPFLLDLARVNHERTADWTGGIPTWHGVNLCEGFREPAEYYQQSRDLRYVQATVRNYDSIMSAYGQVPGGMFGADENARAGYAGPRQAAETCSMVEFMHSDEMLVAITGDPLWADRCEDVAFNSLPSSMTADLEGLHYLTAPNMIQCDRAGKAPMLDNDGKMLYFDPSYHRCCQHNVAFGWPYYTEHLWMAASGSGLAAVLYAPSRVTARVGNGSPVTITENTDYPFGDTVTFSLSMERETAFPLTLRIPAWCTHARVTVNGADAGVAPVAGKWVILERSWKTGDVVMLDLPGEITVKRWMKNGNTLSVSRGPLTYALKITERWERSGGTDRWPAFEVFPTTPWNYGLIADPAHPSQAFELIRKEGPLGSQPFTQESAPLELRARARRVPSWKQEANGLIGEIPGSPLRVDTPLETVTLIPMGCARLRVSVFPAITQ